MKWKRFQKGFTLVEIIVVLVILAILAAIAIPTAMGFVQNAEDAKVYSKMDEVKTAVNAAFLRMYGANQVVFGGHDTVRYEFTPKLAGETGLGGGGLQNNNVFVSSIVEYLEGDVDINNLGVVVSYNTGERRLNLIHIYYYPEGYLNGSVYYLYIQGEDGVGSFSKHDVKGKP